MHPQCIADADHGSCILFAHLYYPSRSLPSCPSILAVSPPTDQLSHAIYVIWFSSSCDLTNLIHISLASACNAADLLIARLHFRTYSHYPLKWLACPLWLHLLQGRIFVDLPISWVEGRLPRVGANPWALKPMLCPRQMVQHHLVLWANKESAIYQSLKKRLHNHSRYTLNTLSCIARAWAHYKTTLEWDPHYHVLIYRVRVQCPNPSQTTLQYA